MTTLAIILAIMFGGGQSCSNVPGKTIANAAGKSVLPLWIKSAIVPASGPSVTLNWELHPDYTLNAEMVKPHAVAVVAVPVGMDPGLALFEGRTGGEARFFPTQPSASAVKEGQIEISLVQGVDYHIYAAGYICDLAEESKAGLIAWQQMVDPFGVPKVIHTGEYSNSVSGRAFGLDDADGNYKGSIIWFALPGNFEDLTISQIGAIGGSGTPTGWQKEGDQVLNSENGRSVFVANGRWNLVIWDNRTASRRTEYDFEIKDGSGAIYQMKIPVNSGYFANSLSSMVDAQIQNLGSRWPNDDYAGFAVHQLFSGGFVDEGEAIAVNLKWMKDNSQKFPPTWKEISDAEGLIRKKPHEFTAMAKFETPSEINVFFNGFSKIDVRSVLGKWIIGGDRVPTATEMEAAVKAHHQKYLLSWNSSVFLFAREYNGNFLHDLRGTSYEQGKFKFSLPQGDNKFIIVDRGLLKELMQGGLWASNGGLNVHSEFEDNANPVLGDKIHVNISTYPGVWKTQRLIAYSDPRELLGVEKVSLEWSQTGLKNEHGIVSKGFTGASRVVLPTKNAAAMKVASTGLGPNGPPGISISEIVASSLPKGDIEIESHSGSAFKVIVPNNIPSSEEGGKYSVLFGLTDEHGKERLLAPLTYTPTSRLHYVLVGGSDGASHVTARRLADKYIQKMAEAGQYTELLDMSEWRWGDVYWHNTGLSLEEKAALDLRLLVNGRPRISSSGGTQSMLPAGSFVVFGKSSYFNLSGQRKAFAEQHLGGEFDASSYEYSDPSILDLTPRAAALLDADLLCATTEDGNGSPFCFQPEWMKQLTWESPAIARSIAKEVLLDYATFGGYSVYSAISEKKVGHSLVAAVIAAAPLIHQLRYIGKFDEIALRHESDAFALSDDIAALMARKGETEFDVSMDLITRSRTIVLDPGLDAPFPKGVTITGKVNNGFDDWSSDYFGKIKKAYDPLRNNNEAFEDMQKRLYALWKDGNSDGLRAEANKLVLVDIRDGIEFAFKLNDGWPPYRGFDFTDGSRMKARLEIGFEFDRYTGAENALYDRGVNVGRKGDSWGVRGLDEQVRLKNGYKKYCTYVVKKPIENVEWGNVAAWFDSPGGGQQGLLPTPIFRLIYDGYLDETCVDFNPFRH